MTTFRVGMNLDSGQLRPQPGNERVRAALAASIVGAAASSAWAQSAPPMHCGGGLTFPGGLNACRDYPGSGWTVEAAGSDCTSIPGARGGTLTLGTRCATTGATGSCRTSPGAANEANLIFYAGDIATLARACEGSLGGTWSASSPGGQENGGASPLPESLLPEARAALTSDARVAVSPDACDERCMENLVTAGAAITFAPTAAAPTSGLILVPDGSVDPRAYAVAAREIAAAGFLVAIVPTEGAGGSALTDMERVQAAVAEHPEIDHWALGGLGTGGTTAARYVAAGPRPAIEALALFSAYPPEDIDLSRASNLRVYSLRASEDPRVDATRWDAARARLPSHGYFAVLHGANRSQFGYQAAWADDGPAGISRRRQHGLYVGATIHMLRRLGLPAERDWVSPVYQRIEESPEQICAQAQVALGGFEGAGLTEADVAVREYDTALDFRGDHPGFGPDGGKPVRVIGYAAQTANPDDLTAPPIFPGEVWCKLKSREAVWEQLGAEPSYATGDPSCATINRAIFAWARHFLGRDDADAGALVFGNDLAAASGPGFIEANLGWTESVSGVATLASPALRTPLEVPAPFGGVHYCKLWSRSAAVQFIESLVVNPDRLSARRR